MALNCDLNKRIFTFEGKDYSYDEFRALMYDGLLERIPELTAETKKALATEEGKAEVEQGLTKTEIRERLNSLLFAQSSQEELTQEVEERVDEQQDEKEEVDITDRDTVNSIVLEHISNDEIEEIASEEGVSAEEVPSVVVEAAAEEISSGKKKLGIGKALRRAVDKIKKIIAIAFLSGSIIVSGSSFSIKNDGTFTFDLKSAVESLLPSEQAQWAKRFLDKKGLIEIADNQIASEAEPVKIAETPKPEKVFQIIGAVADSYNPSDSLLSYRSQWSNSEGFRYVPIPVRKDNKGIKISGVVGVGHFLLDASAAPGKEYSHPWSANLVEKAKKNNDWVPVFSKNSDGSVTLKYKRGADVLASDFTPTPLRQMKWSELNFDNVGAAKGFKSSIKEVKKKDGSGTYLIFKTEKGYSRFSGGSVVFIFNDKYGNVVVRDFAGSLDGIKKEGNQIVKDFQLSENDLIIGYYDVGSFSAKPKAKDGVLSTEQWRGFNNEPMTGGALAIPIEGNISTPKETAPTESKKEGAPIAAGVVLALAGAGGRRRKSSKTHVGTIPIKTYQSVISELDDAIANISDDDFSKMTKRQQVARVIEVASKIMEGTRWFKGRDASERKEAMQSLSEDISQKLGFEPAPKEQMQRVKMREEVRDLKKQVSEAVKSAVRAAISGRKAGFEEGLTAQREKSQRELEAKMSKAEREKERLAQKRVMQGYAQGIAEGRLGGEIYGTKRGRAQGRREEQQKMSQDRVVFLEYLKDIFIDPTTGKTVLKGDQYRQAAAIGRAAARVNPSNPLSVARFKKYAENVIKKAEYEKDLKDARAAKNKAKDMAKGAPQNHKDALQEISSIDVSMIEDPAKYAERVNDYLNVMRSVTSEKYESKSSDEMMDYAESLSLQVEAEYSKLLREEYELSDIGGMSAKQIYDALQSGQFDSGTTNLNSSKREEVKKRVTNLAKYADMSLAEWVKEYDLMGAIGAGAEFTPKEENIFRSLLNPEFEYMSFKQMMEYVKVVDNIITNDSFSGSGKIAEAARASKRAKKLASSISPSTVKAIEGVAMNTMSIADLNVYFFGRGLLNAKIQRAIGIGDYVNANKKHGDMMKAIGKQVVDFYNALNKKDQNAFSDAAVNAEAVVAYAIQHMPGMSDADGLEVRKQILLENIERLRGRNKKEYTDKANHQQIAFDAILKDATSRKQVLENLKRIYPGAHESIEFLINITKPYKDMVRENLNVMWNEASPNDSVGTWDDPYYIPIAYQRIAPSRDIDIDEGSPRAIQDMGQTAPSATKSRLVYKMLPKDKIIDLNPRSVTINRLNSNLYDAVVGDSLVYISQFMRARGIDENVFGNSDNLNYYYTSIKKWIAKYQEINNKDFVSGFLNRNVNFVRDVVVSTKLGTLNQVVKQVPEALTQVMVMTGSGDAFVNLFSGEFMDANANALMSKYAVGERGATVAGTNWEGALSKTYKEIEAATMAKNPNLVKVSAKRLQELTTKPLSLSDASVAKAAWMAYYKYARRAQGYEVNSWETENANHDSDELRKEAALFAETMIDYTMVSSDPKKAASISQKTNEGWKNLAKATILLFSGFAVQSFSRLRLDFSTLHNYRNMKNAGNPMADKSEAGRALRSITARTVGAGAFWTTSVYVAPLLAEFFAYVVSELLSMDDEDDDDGQTIAALVAVTVIMQSMGLLWGDVAKSFSIASEKIEERDKKKFNQDVIREMNVSGDIAKIYMDSIKKNELKKIEQKQLDKKNRIKVGFFSSLVGIDVQPNLNAAIIDAINYIDYTIERINGNKSVINRGKTKPFTEWIKDQENPAFYRYEYKRGETFIDEPISGALEIFLNLPQDADKIIQKAFNRAEKQQNRKNVMNVLKKMKSGELDRLSQDGSTTYMGESSTYQSESQ